MRIGSYPTWRHPAYDTEVTFEAEQREAAERARAALARLLPAEQIVEPPEERAVGPEGEADP